MIVGGADNTAPLSLLLRCRPGALTRRPGRRFLAVEVTPLLRGGMMTLTEVARRVGVSRTLVSLQVHGHRRMSPAVEQAIRELRAEEERATEELVAARFAARGLPEVAHSIMTEYTR